MNTCQLFLNLVAAILLVLFAPFFILAGFISDLLGYSRDDLDWPGM